MSRLVIAYIDDSEARRVEKILRDAAQDAGALDLVGEFHGLADAVRDSKSVDHDVHVTVKPLPVEPIRTEKTLGFACPGGLREVEHAVYPKHPRGKALRALRTACDITMRDAASLAGVTAEQLSGLEWGRYVLASDNEWCELYAMLATEYERRADARRVVIDVEER